MEKISPTKLAHDAEERMFREAKAEARQRTLEMPVVLDALEKRARSIHWWLQRFSTGSRKRPAHEVETKRLELSVMVQVHDFMAKKRDDKAKTQEGRS